MTNVNRRGSLAVSSAPAFLVMCRWYLPTSKPREVLKFEVTVLLHVEEGIDPQMILL